ncbi:MAG: phosphatase PAP2 family protein [Rhizobiaceae bacterium]|nr:phosphatase PAP2 family protein [Rhizobiaceae bacterium]
MNSGTNSWTSDIVNYFRFVFSRKITASHPAVPVTPGIVGALLIFATIIYLLFIWADPLLLASVRDPGREFPQIFQYITMAGQVEWILIISGVILIALSFSQAGRFTGHKFRVWHRVFLFSYFTFTAVSISGLLGVLLKNTIGRARPAFTPDTNIWLSIPFEDSYRFASFPSGHATTGGAIAMVLALLFPRWRWLFFLGGISVAVSRPVLGVHFPSDVVAGFVLGIVIVWLYARLFARKRLLFKFQNNGRLALRSQGSSKKPLSGSIFWKLPTSAGISKT